MATFNKALFHGIWQPGLQFVRFRKINIQKPFPPHYERAKIEHLCKPIFAKNVYQDPNTPLHEICKVGVKFFEKPNVANPYVDLMGKELLNWFNHSKMIAFFHKCPMNSDEMFETRLSLKKLQMKYKLHGKEIMTAAVKGTKYEPLLTLYQSHTSIAFGPEVNVQGLLKTTKKIPKLILLAAIVEDRFMSRAEFERLASLPDLTTARANLVATLNEGAQTVVRHLNHHQGQLVQHLDTHSKSST